MCSLILCIGGKSYGKALINRIMNHHDLQGLRRWMLMTQDAHGLYEQVGFQTATKPGFVMEKNNIRTLQKRLISIDGFEHFLFNLPLH